MEKPLPLFSRVGRVERTPTDNRARLFQLAIALGLIAATLAFLAELGGRAERLKVVEVDLSATPAE